LVQWTGNDPDGDPLVYTLQYSWNGGASWVTLLASSTATEFRFDSRHIIGGAAVHFRVLASDGIHTSVATAGPVEIAQAPRMELAAADARFRNVLLGEAGEQTVELRNTGDGPLTLTAMTTDSELFTAVSPRLPVQVPAGAVQPVIVRFRPDTEGVKTGTLVLRGVGVSELSFPLTGSGVASAMPNLEIAPAALAFGNVAVGQSVELRLTLRNLGPGRLRVSALRVTGGSFAVTGSAAPLEIGAAQERVVTIRFAVSAPGAQTGTLVIASNDPVRPNLTVPLAGAGAGGPSPSACSFTLNPTFRDYNELANTGSIAVRASAQTCSWTASSNVPWARVTGTSAGAAVNGVGSGTGNGDVNYQVDSTTGPARRGTITVAGLEFVINQQGPPAGIPNIRLQPGTSLSFGSVAVGSSTTQVVNISNRGEGTLTVTSIASSSPMFTVSPAGPLSIAPGDTTPVTVRFAPTASGPQSGILTFASSDPAAPRVSLGLSGIGTSAAGPSLTTSPASISFGSVQIGAFATAPLTLTNSGNAALTITSITSSNSRFTVTPAGPMTLPAATLTDVVVRFTPTDAGVQSATLTILSNDPVKPTVIVNVTGTASGSPAVETRVLSVDDGSFEISGGAAAGAPAIYFVNRVTPPSYPATLRNVQIMFLNHANALKTGDAIRVLIGTNPSGSATIDNIRLLAASTSVGTTGLFNSYQTPATTIQSGDFVVGFTTANPPNIFPGAIDTTPPSRQKSYLSFDGVTFQQLDTIQGLAGNLGIRATVELGGGAPLPAGGGEAYWKFDEGAGTVAGDSTGNGNTGTLLNGATWTTGVRGTALSLDGVDDYVNAGSSLNLQSTTFTIEAWIKGDPSMEAFGRIVDSGFATGFALGRNGGGRQALFEFRGSTFLVSNTDVIDNTWHHVVVVKSGATATMYTDGILQANIAVNAGSSVSTLPLFIGYNPGEGTRGHWKGQIDELRIYTRALTAAEIQTNFNALKPAGGTTGPGTGSSTPNPQAYWRFDEGSGTVAGDATGHGNTGALQNGAGWTAGIRGTAVSLDGVDDYVSIANSFRLTSANFTLDAWIKGDPGMEQFGRILDSGYATGFALGRNGGGRQVLFEFRGSPYLISNADAIDNNWHHVAVVKSGGTATLYVDGAVQASVAVNAEAPTNTLPLFIGYNPGEGTRGHWKGQLDEVRIYDRALSAAEVQANYSARGQ
jgi:hypothetical protein